MNRIQPDDLISIDPVHGRHYHMRNCRLAGDLIIQFKNLKCYKPAIGNYYKKCACVDAYEQGKELRKL